MECWNVTTDIRVVSEYLMDAPLEAGREDKIANMLIGIEALYEAKFDKLFRQFEQMVREHAKSFDQMSDEELQDMIEKDLADRAKKHEKENPLRHNTGFYQT
jgi:hypothetical protein